MPLIDIQGSHGANSPEIELRQDGLGTGLSAWLISPATNNLSYGARAGNGYKRMPQKIY